MKDNLIEPNLIKVSQRDAIDEIHLECRFSDGQKFAAVTIDKDFPELANKIEGFLREICKKGKE